MRANGGLCHVFLAGRLSLEKKTYNVTEDIGSVEICAVLTGGVSPYPIIISILDIGITAKFPSKIILISFLYSLLVLSLSFS